jgi:hypothetical protein
MSRLRVLVRLTIGILCFSAVAPPAGAAPLFDVPWVGYDTAVYPEGLGPWASAVADYDGDGVADLATVSFEGSAHLSILLADGEGGYHPPRIFPLLLESLGIAAGDYDRDGDVDVAVTDTDRFWAGSTISIYRNDGAANFVRSGVFSAGRTGPSGLVAADFDGDGWLDLATAHDAYIVCGATMAWLINDRAGGFGSPRLLPMQSCTRSITAGDLDGDGDPDAVVGHESNRFTVLVNNGGTLSSKSVINGVPATSITELPAVHIADVDRDGDNDVFFSNMSTGDVGLGAIGLFRNNGDATFAPGETMRFGGGIYSNGGVDVNTADVTGDGWPDVIATTEATGYWILFQGDGEGAFLPARALRAGDRPMTSEAADLDGDADLEVVIVSTGSQEASVYTNPGDGAFVQPIPVDMIYPAIAPAFLTNLQAADVDADGDLDLVVPYYSDFHLRRGISVRRGNGDGTFSDIEDYTDNRRPRYLRLGDVDGDGDLDMVWVDETARLKVRTNAGDGSFGATVGKGGIDGAFIELHDVDVDGDLDVVFPGFFYVGVRLNDGAGNFGTTVRSNEFQDVPEYLALGNFDPDGLPDLLTDTGIQGYADISFGNGDGSFAPPFTVPTGRDVHAIDVGDVDGDGNLDFGAFYNLDEKGLSIRRGRGDGNFFALENYHGSRGFNDHTSSLLLRDADRDGDLDALTANFSPQDFSLWLNEGDGTYARGLRYGVGETAYDIAFGDFDGDGVGDVAVVSQVAQGSWWYPGVSIFRGLAETQALTLTQTPLVRGQEATWTVARATPGEAVRIYRSRTGTGDGPCPPQLGGLCLDLLPPVRVLGNAIANANGVATFTMTIPQSTPVGTPFHTQAVIRRGPDGADSVKSNTSSAVVQ